jgi:hypothetical protein
MALEKKWLTLSSNRLRARKVVKDIIKNACLVSTALYYSQVLKQPIKPSQAHDIYLTKEQQLLRKIDWLIKDPEAWDVM